MAQEDAAAMDGGFEGAAEVGASGGSSGYEAFDPAIWPDEDDGPDAADATEGQPELLDSMHLWEGDAGTLPRDARAALLRLVKGPYLSETADAALWRALLNHTEAVKSRLADLFLELYIDAEAGVAFARNVSVENAEFPKAATSYTMTLLDSIMVLLLRKELLAAGTARAFIGKTELFEQMGQYRALDKSDQSAFLKKLDASWTRLAEKHRLLIKSDVEGRYEISPVLKLVFGAEEAAAVYAEFQRLRGSFAAGGPSAVSPPAANSAPAPEPEVSKAGESGKPERAGSAGATFEEGTLFDGLF
jgi:hypothetical protein